MANLNKFVSLIKSHPFKKLHGAHSSLLTFRIRITFLKLATRILAPNMILAPFHSMSSSHHQTVVKHPQSVFEKITNLDDALKLFDEMTHRRPLPSAVQFGKLLQAVSQMKHYSCSIELFKQMNALCVPVNVYTITIVIKCCFQLYRTSEGFAVLGYGFKHVVLPNVYTFSTLLNGLILEDKVHKAGRLFKKLIKEELCEPNTVMYNTMIKGLCKHGNNDTSIGLLKLMDERDCKPDVVTYNTIIDSLCKDKLVDDALNLFKEMVFHKGILPDVVTYNSLIHGLCNLCRWDEVDRMLKEMEEQRISLDVHTFSILVDALCKEGKAEDAKGVFNLMIQKGKDPDVVTYNSLIDGYCLRGEMSKARQAFDPMEHRGLVPNIVSYNSLLNGYCKKQNIEEAMHLFREMIKKVMKPNVVTYNVLLQGLLKYVKHDSVEMLLLEMEGRGFSLEASTVSLLLDHIKVKSLDASLLKLIGRLVRNEGVVEPCFKV